MAQIFIGNFLIYSEFLVYFYSWIRSVFLSRKNIGIWDSTIFVYYSMFSMPGSWLLSINSASCEKQKWPYHYCPWSGTTSSEDHWVKLAVFLEWLFITCKLLIFTFRNLKNIDIFYCFSVLHAFSPCNLF